MIDETKVIEKIKALDRPYDKSIQFHRGRRYAVMQCLDINKEEMKTPMVDRDRSESFLRAWATKDDTTSPCLFCTQWESKQCSCEVELREAVRAYFGGKENE